MKLSRDIGHFRLDLATFWLLVAVFVAARAWLAEHPEPNPWAGFAREKVKSADGWQADIYSTSLYSATSFIVSSGLKKSA